MSSVVVTGAARGVGRAVAASFVSGAALPVDGGRAAQGQEPEVR